MKLTVKNWTDFQHYKDRAPPWIKLHKGLLDNIDYYALSDQAGKALPLIWLIASEFDGAIPDTPVMAFRMRIGIDVMDDILTELASSGFLCAGQAEQLATHDANGKTIAQKIASANGFGSRHISDKTKREVWGRDGGKCVQCSSIENIEYDHKTPVSKGGNSEPENIQLLCRPCNRKKRALLTVQAEQLATRSLGRRTLETERETEKENTFVAGKPTTDICPQKEIIALYAGALPELPQPRAWEGAREKSLTARWRWVLSDLKMKGKPHDREAGLGFFKRMFDYIHSSDFLMGRTDSGWNADLGWIVKAENFAKIIQGNYENKEKAA